MRPGDTIVAIASGPGRSARGIVRLSGPGTIAALRALLADPPDESAEPVARPVQVRVPVQGGLSALTGLMILYRAPRSYTGEDAAEVIVPGNPALLERVQSRALRAEGVRPALPGEFTARAFLNARLTPEQAEGVRAVIAASNDAELDTAQRLLSGELGAAYRALADNLASALALVEAGIDFTDQEDVVAIAPDALLERLEAVRVGIASIVGPCARTEATTGEPVIALVGPPNAGKSTLFNALLGRRRSVVSPEAGTTRDAIAEHATLGDSPWNAADVVLMDLAGLDEALGAARAVDAAAQRAARDAIDRADVLLLCDPSGRFALRGVEARGRPVIRVRTKADLPGGDDPAGDLAVCALDEWNLGALRRAIADAARAARGGAEAGGVPQRHRAALSGALEATDEALGVVRPQSGSSRLEGAEIIAGSMRAGLDRLGEVCGGISPDDVIGRIFSTFCVGK